MTKRPKALIAWSSGKGSAYALHETRRTGDYEIVGAVTTVAESFAWRTSAPSAGEAFGDRSAGIATGTSGG